MNTLPPHMLRVVDEQARVDSDLSKLRAFIESKAFAALEDDEQFRLQQQEAYMNGYNETLKRRIEAA